MQKDVPKYEYSRMIPSLVSLAVIVIGLRVLGPQEYGQYIIYYSTAIFVSTLTFGWIRQSLQRFMCVPQEQHLLLVNRFFYITVASILAGILIIGCVLLILFRMHWPEIIILTGFYSLYTLFEFHLSIHRAWLQNRFATWLEGCYYGLFIGMALFFVFRMGFKDYRALILSMVFSILLVEVGRFFILSKERTRISISTRHIDSRFLKKVFHFGQPATIWLVSFYALSIADRFILKWYRGFETTGIYSGISDLMFVVVTLLCMPILLSYQPKILEKWTSGHRDEAIALINEALSFEFLTGVVVFILFMILRQTLYYRFLGINVDGIFPLSVIMLINALLWQAILLIQKPLEMITYQRYKNGIMLACMAGNITANIIFIPHFGFLAAAWIALGSNVLYLLFLSWFYRNLNRKMAK